MTIVGIAAFAFLLLTVINALIADRVRQQLAVIQEQYVPKVELGPKLEAGFERLRRSLQDAVAAQDVQALGDTHERKRELLEQLMRAGVAVSARDATALQGSIEDYYSAAYDVSRRLMQAETGERLVDAISVMQGRHARTVDLIRKVTAFDRGKLAQAFLAAARAEADATQLRLGLSAGCLMLVLLLSLGLSRGVLRSLAELAEGFERFGRGDFSQSIPIRSRDEVGELARQANEMAQNLERLGEERDRTDWLKNGQAGLVHELRGELEPREVAARAVRFLTRYLEAPAGVLYYRGRDDRLRPLGQHASFAAGASEAVPSFAAGEGLVGQAAQQEGISIVTELPEDYFRIRSGLGEAGARAVVFLPLIQVGRVTGVVEFACFKPWSSLSSELLLSVRETLAIAIEVALARTALRELLLETQRQADRLAAQEDELRATNEELQAQQEELRNTNEELTRQARALEEQRRTLEEKNQELDEARQSLEQKASELTTVSAYKTQFLANMSHELRTPLNSLLLLSNLLADNEGGNLTDKQIEFCRTIHGAGKDLLALINQVLDLAKVESGKQALKLELVEIRQLADHARQIFEPLARDKGLEFSVEVNLNLPERLCTDVQRLEQILNNLLGNAIKFTERGRVGLSIGRPAPGAGFGRAGLRTERTVAFVVSDTGIGIAPEHQERIFSPFEQVDASPDRRYGGTGLGLTIARELAALLGGELQLQSAPGQGSSFICYLPFDGPAQASEQDHTTAAPGASVAMALATSQGSPARPNPGVARDRDPRGPVERTLLVIEDDPVFADVLREIIEGQGLKFLLARDGETGLELARQHRPGGIILEVKLAGMDGFSVVEVLRAHRDTAAIPVHFVSAVEAAERGMALGAIGYLRKPATEEQLVQVVESLARRVGETAPQILIVEDDTHEANSVIAQLRQCNMQARSVSSAREALAALEREHFGCVVLDLGLPDMDGLELLQSLRKRHGADMPPVVVYTGRALTKAEAQTLEAYTEAVVLKGGPAAERLLDELRIFTQRMKDGLPSKKQLEAGAQIGHLQLTGRRVLVVDDDMRTVYALSALLRSKGLEVLVADTGRTALEVLDSHPEAEAVLMDIMMPEMDGYEAMRRIRQDIRFRNLPIIALTAKAMRDDRDRCIEAGATDYLPKPIDGDRLLAALQALLNEEHRGGFQQPV